MKVYEKKKRVVVVCLSPQQNVKLATTARKCTKKGVMHVQSCCFVNLNSSVFFAVVVAVVVDVA